MSLVPERIKIAGFPGCELFDVDTEEIKDTFRVFVSCPDFLDKNQKYPVIYALDGNALFFEFVSIHAAMMMVGELPPAVIVGIGYPDGFDFSKRSRDYTPTQATDHRKGKGDAGGGPAFLRFLVNALMPLIEASYPVQSSDSTLAGVSLGGLFPIWALLTSPSSFNRYISCSPALQINDEEAWEWEEATAMATKDIDAAIFLAAGGLEDGSALKATFENGIQNDLENRDWLQGVVDNYESQGWPRGEATIVPEFAEKLRSRNYPSLRVNDIVFPGETHMSVPPAAISRGLRFVFGDAS